MSSVSFSFKEDSVLDGFILITNDSLIPKLIKPQDSLEYQDLGGIPHHECVYILAIAIIDLLRDDIRYFKETSKFIKAYFKMRIMKSNPIFKNSLEKMVVEDYLYFINNFKNQLLLDINKSSCIPELKMILEDEILKLRF